MTNYKKIIAGLVILIIAAYIAFLYFRENENFQSLKTTTTTDPVIRYERPIPTNYKEPVPTHTKNLNLYHFVKKPVIKQGIYADNHVDILTTNGIYTMNPNF